MNHISTPPNYIPKPDPKHKPVFVDNTSAPTCKICDKGKLIFKKVYKFGTMCAIAGIVIAIPSLFLAIVLLIVSISFFTETNNETGLLGLVITALAFASGGLGYFLAQTKKILKCNHCGATIDAS